MITDKIEMLKHEANQKEFTAMTQEFRKALLNHFKVVDTYANNLIQSRWSNDEGGN